jgi:hypothetical protein
MARFGPWPLVLGIAAPINQFTWVDTESIGQLTHRGHVRLGFVALSPRNSGLCKPSTLGQLRLG